VPIASFPYRLKSRSGVRDFLHPCAPDWINRLSQSRCERPYGVTIICRQPQCTCTISDYGIKVGTATPEPRLKQTVSVNVRAPVLLRPLMERSSRYGNSTSTVVYAAENKQYYSPPRTCSHPDSRRGTDSVWPEEATVDVETSHPKYRKIHRHLHDEVSWPRQRKGQGQLDSFPSWRTTVFARRICETSAK